MPPRITTNQHHVAEEDELYRRIEPIIDTWLVRKLDVFLHRLTERMRALMEARQEVDPRRGRVPNSTADLEDVEYDFYSEGGATLFSEFNFIVIGSRGKFVEIRIILVSEHQAPNQVYPILFISIC
ncbi:hypothetical protein CRG98_037867 [Punica granatum]|uniref:Uncharacterized protein n=1 Tax=Punica granatum TaxID=22663 RepID=A0A2I0ICM6_PUNGR|nr:hypothetical protein CRG98_037867 [Punica granatum]